MVPRVPGYPSLPGPGYPVPVPPQPPPTRSGTRFQILRPGCNSNADKRSPEYTPCYVRVDLQVRSCGMISYLAHWGVSLDQLKLLLRQTPRQRVHPSQPNRFAGPHSLSPYRVARFPCLIGDASLRPQAPPLINPTSPMLMLLTFCDF